jgi:hypothetical protein
VEYLRERARPAAIAPLLDALAPVVRATRIERGRTETLVATVYHLIDRGSSEAYLRLVEGAAPDLDPLRVHGRGPRPCYAFT